ncbi:nuclear transport factor 2 family protein [Roseibium litorale]|uniref:Nuclear transport factor 2 family protein n=1 Tax=Roseibium litorale TaxID=2803841 RepID=A0ABR9CTX0_9HYPH|nr:nuclear transport factor 2 family protein [Roseibium litorale]MBD8893860.1 nuclear transport factor 2 family protein [Roseibium litorale]
MKFILPALSGICIALSAPASAQEAVTAAPDVEALFTSPDPQLNANKQIVYHVFKDLLGAGHWEKADQYLSEEYLQHNPNVASGRKTVVDFFTKTLKVEPRPIPEKLDWPVVSVTAEGDLVVVATRRVVKDPTAAGGEYTTTWFDMWRIKDGKATEHWDTALRNENPTFE